MSARSPLHAKEPPKEEAMRAFLARLDGQLGGSRAYLRSLGVPEEAIEKFVTGMVQ